MWNWLRRRVVSLRVRLILSLELLQFVLDVVVTYTFPVFAEVQVDFVSLEQTPKKSVEETFLRE